MSWSAEQVSKLIEEYEKNVILYDTKSPKYHNKCLRQRAIESIKYALQVSRPGVTEVDIQKKINGIRNTYASERRKYIESTKSGAGTDEVNINKCSKILFPYFVNNISPITHNSVYM